MGPQEKQLAGSRQQAVLHPRQKYGKVLVRTPFIISQTSIIHFVKHADNDAPRKTEKKNWTKIILGFKNDPYIHLVLKISLIVNVTIYIQAKFSNLKLSA